MYSERPRRSSQRKSLSNVPVEELPIKVVEIENPDQFTPYRFEKQGDWFVCVGIIQEKIKSKNTKKKTESRNTTIGTDTAISINDDDVFEDCSKSKIDEPDAQQVDPGKSDFNEADYVNFKTNDEKICKDDILVNIGPIPFFSFRSVRDLKQAIETSGIWPLKLELRTRSYLNDNNTANNYKTLTPRFIDLSSGLMTMSPSSPVPSLENKRKNDRYIPQIPLLVPQQGSPISHEILTNNEVDLTEDDECVVIAESNINVNGNDSAAIENRSVPQVTTFVKGQIVRTPFGVGSVKQDYTPPFLLVILLCGTGESEALAYVHLPTELVTDCTSETTYSYDGMTLTRRDTARLWPGLYFNDNLIDLFLHKLMKELPAKIHNRTFLFTSHFYTKLSEDPEAVMSWTNTVDIFEKDFIIVPINEQTHWSLAIICFLKRFALQMDLKMEDDLTVAKEHPTSLVIEENIEEHSDTNVKNNNSQIAYERNVHDEEIPSNNSQDEIFEPEKQKRKLKKPRLLTADQSFSNSLQTLPDMLTPVILKFDSTKGTFRQFF